MYFAQDLNYLGLWTMDQGKRVMIVYVRKSMFVDFIQSSGEDEVVYDVKA